MGKRACLCALFLVLAGCGSGGGTTNSEPVIHDDGMWRGTWTYEEGSFVKDQGTAEVVIPKGQAGGVNADMQLTSTGTGSVTRIVIPTAYDTWTITLPGKPPATYTGAGFDFHTSMGVSYGPGEPRTLHISVPIVNSGKVYKVTATKVEEG